MKVILFIGWALSVAACSTSNDYSSVLFYDTLGAEFNVRHAGEEIKKNYGLTSIPTIVLIATNSEKLPDFIAQMDIVNRLNAEEYEYLLIVANAAIIDESGYHTRTTDAESILGKDDFKCIVFGEKGRIIVATNRVISYEALKNYLTRPSN